MLIVGFIAGIELLKKSFFNQADFHEPLLLKILHKQMRIVEKILQLNTFEVFHLEKFL